MLLYTLRVGGGKGSGFRFAIRRFVAFERLENFWCSVTVMNCVIVQELGPFSRGRDNVFGIAALYGLGGPGIESRWERGFPDRP
jgi:hypothetical protein